MLDTTTASIIEDAVANATANATKPAQAAAPTKRWYKRKAVYYIAGGAVLIGAVGAAVYIFLPGMRGAVAVAAETTVAAATEVGAEIVAETVG